MNRRRVVVTGMGLITPLGDSVLSSWRNIREGRLGIRPISRFTPEEVGIYVAGEITDFDASHFLSHRELRRTDRIHQFALYAAGQALENSQLEITASTSTKIGCIVGTSVGGIQTMTDAVHAYNANGLRAVNPFTIPTVLGDSISARVALHYNLKGIAANVGAACATGNAALGIASDMIGLGRADVMLAGAAEASLVPWVIAGFKNMTATSNEQNPAYASLPFHQDRSGFVMAEGAAVLILEALDHALERDASILAEIVGFGQTSDAYHISAPDESGEGAARAMQLALNDAGLEAEEIDYINAHGTGTSLNDLIETKAIKSVFADSAYDVSISSTKSMTGHMLSASAAVESVWSIMALCDNFVPPTIGLDNPDPLCDLDYTPLYGKNRPIKYVMNNAFGFGGLNAVLILARYTP